MRKRAERVAEIERTHIFSRHTILMNFKIVHNNLHFSSKFIIRRKQKKNSALENGDARENGDGANGTGSWVNSDGMNFFDRDNF